MIQLIPRVCLPDWYRPAEDAPDRVSVYFRQRSHREIWHAVFVMKTATKTTLEGLQFVDLSSHTRTATWQAQPGEDCVLPERRADRRGERGEAKERTAMNTAGYEEWFRDRVETIDGRKGLLTVGKDDQGTKEGFQWWCFTPDGGAPREDLMIVKMWRGEPKDEKKPRIASPFNTIKSIGGHVFTYRKCAP